MLYLHHLHPSLPSQTPLCSLPLNFMTLLLYIIIQLYIKPDRSIMCYSYVCLFKAGHLGLDLLPHQLEALHLGVASCEISPPMLECQTVLSFYRFCLGSHSFEISWV